MKKAISLLMAIVMVFSILPTAAFAVNENAPVISFETTFTEDMTVGDTFTVTAMLDSNPGFNSTGLPLTWNDEVVRFTGFEKYEDDFPVSEVFESRGWTAVANHELGIVTAARTTDYTANGTLFTANFEIVGSGDLNIGFVLENLADTSKQFQMGNFNGDDLSEAAAENIDYSAIEGLSVAGSGDEGAAIPDGAPFTAITTDAGNAAEITQMDDVTANVWGSPKDPVPYYHVVIPADATEVYITHPSSVDPFCDTSYNAAYGYFADTASWTADSFTFAFAEADDGYTVTFPVVGGVDTDWDGTPDAEYSFVADEEGYVAYVIGMENNAFDPICFFSFAYAAFEDGGEEHTCVYDQQNTDETYLVSAADCENAAVYYYSCACGEAGTDTFTYGSANGHDWADATCQTPKKCGTCGAEEGSVVEHSYTDGKCIWCGTDEPVAAYGYYFATSADVSAENGGTAVVHVKITGHSDENVTTYNAYDVTLTFDSDKLEYVGYDGAVKSDNGQVKVEGNTIRIVGCGAAKTFADELAALTFQTKAEGEAAVTIRKVQVSDQEESVTEDIPEATGKHDEDDTTADTTPEQSIIVVPYTVTKPDFVSGAEKVLPGEDYTFSYNDTTNYTYSGLKVTVDGVEVTPSETDGVYTVENVTGTVVIEVTQTANSYDVTKPESVTGPDQATYGTDYVFTVTPDEDMAIESVTVTDANGNEIPYTIRADGAYVISGTDISGPFTIAVTQTNTKTTVTFSGVAESEVEGGLVQTAEIGKDFIFKLIKEENFVYTVMVGEVELIETNGQYTIPAVLVAAGGVAVTITKVDTSKPVVDVHEYINLDGKVMFLVTAKWKDKVLAYGDQIMFYSSKYAVTGAAEAGAYCWLVVSNAEMNTAEQVMAAAQETIVEAAEGVAATAIGYDYDINETTKVDVNDAQLAYDMYNASYMEFTENLPMLKFLEADMSTDKKLDVNDVAAVISYIVNGASN